MCYHREEVRSMDDEEKISTDEEGYVPRPQWQVWGARLLLAVFLILLALYYFHISRGGQ